MTMNSARSFDELRAAGGELGSCGADFDRISDVVDRVLPRFEVPGSDQEEAVLVFLKGLRDALSDAVFLARCDHPELAQ